MNKIRCAVIGVGYLGNFHAEKYHRLENTDLVAVCDTNQERCDEVAHKYATKAIYNYQDLIGNVDAVSIVVPTTHHFEIAKFFIENGVHVLLEKPITTTVEQANELITLRDQYKVILQIGHLERFNSVLIAMQDVLDKPGYIESHRLSMFNPRGTDVNVMLDLMIHDIDIIQYLIQSPIKDIRANGASVLSKGTDIATARIEFENHCVANVVASRVSIKSERKMRIFQHNAYVFLDFQDRLVSVHSKGEGEMFPGIPEIVKHEQTFEKTDALLEEIKAFTQSIKLNSKPVVTAEEGRDALSTAIHITDLVKQQILPEEFISG